MTNQGPTARKIRNGPACTKILLNATPARWQALFLWWAVYKVLPLYLYKETTKRSERVVNGAEVAQ